jgi:hypothetical protein
MLWGKNPFPFHAINLIIHGINCGLVYLFLMKCIRLHFGSGDDDDEKRLLSSKAVMKMRKKTNDNLEKIAFWAAVLFAVHPVHVEPLGGLVGRADLISSFVFLLGYLIVPNNNQSQGWSTIPVVINFFAILGSLFKENAIVLSVRSLRTDNVWDDF